MALDLNKRKDSPFFQVQGTVYAPNGLKRFVRKSTGCRDRRAGHGNSRSGSKMS
jgi:hypothetical protein